MGDRVNPKSIFADPARRPKLDPSLYDLHGEELAFFQQQTGITDEEELKKHILDVQSKAYDVYGYPCIRRFSFLTMRISTLPGYKAALKLINERENPIFLDMGCCFGNDTRKIVADGWPVQNVIGSDLRPAYWGYGHELFKSTPETFPAAFIKANIFDPQCIPPPHEPRTDASILNAPLPALNTLTSFHQLAGRISVIHSSAFFHLFSEEGQLSAAKILSSLLLPQKGSVIFGMHVARPVKGIRTEVGVQETVKMFCHSPESWEEMWERDVFGGRADVKVNTHLIEVKRVDLLSAANANGELKEGENPRFWVMKWSVTRLS